MAAKKEITECVNSISFSEIKIGQYIKLKNDDNLYVVVPKGQTLVLIPINLKECVKVNIYDVNKPTITHLFSAKTSACLKVINEVFD